MKEATNELTNAVVVTVCIAILVAFFYFTLWPIIKQNFVAQTACEKASCGVHPNSEGMVSCELDGQVFMCKYKG